MANMFYGIYRICKTMSLKLKRDQLAAFSAQAAFFLMLSAVPFVLLICIIVKYLPISQTTLFSGVYDILPSQFAWIFTKMLKGLNTSSIGVATFISILVAMWSSSKGTMAIERGLNFIDGVEDNKNYFWRRGMNVIYTIIFTGMIILVLLVYVFGNGVITRIIKKTNMVEYSDNIMFIAKLITGPVIVFAIFILIYHRLSDKKYKFLSVLPGAVFSTVGWVALAIGISIYVDYFEGGSSIYGSFASVVIVMLWLYISMYILFLGAELNGFLRIGLLTHLKDMIKWIKARKELNRQNETSEQNNESAEKVQQE